MRERPIIFSTEMVKAILDGRKTQTRRLNGLNTVNDSQSDWELLAVGKPGFGMLGYKLENTAYAIFKDKSDGFCQAIKHPYGKPGDLLWVRESTCQVMRDHAHDLLQGARNQSLTIYKTDFHPDWMEYAREKYGYKWKPSIHMPKDAARIWLEVTQVRVERLCNISEQDALEEGIYRHIPVPGDGNPIYGNYNRIGNDALYFYNPVSSFGSLWESMNGPGSWQQNPFVWVVKFKVLSTNGKPKGGQS